MEESDMQSPLKNHWITLTGIAALAAGCASREPDAATGDDSAAKKGVGENAYCAPGTGGNYVASFGAQDGPAALPQACVYTALAASPAPGRVLEVCGEAHTECATYNNGALQAALDDAQCGDQIVLKAGQRYTGPFLLRPKTPACDVKHWIWVRGDAITQTGAPVAPFPAEGVRVTPCEIGQRSVAAYPAYACAQAGARMPTLQTDPHGQAVLRVEQRGVSYVRFMALDIVKAPQSEAADALVNLGHADGADTGADHVIFDRVLIHGEPFGAGSTTGQESRTGIDAANSSYVALVNSWAYDTYCMGNGCVDSQAFIGGNGTVGPEGPYKIYNNLLATAGESTFMGGAGGNNYQHGYQSTPVGADVEIRANHSFKPLSWFLQRLADAQRGGQTPHPVTKNLGELKSAHRVLWEGNVLENNWQGWQSDQAGKGILLGPKNQNTHETVTVNIDGATVTAIDSKTGQTAYPFSTDMWKKWDGHQWYIPQPPYDDSTRPRVFEYNDQAYAILGVSGPAPGQKDCDHPGVPPACAFSTLTIGPWIYPNDCPNGVCPASPGTVAGMVAYACHPGASPEASVQDVVVRYNEFRNLQAALSIGSARSSHCHDETTSPFRGFSVHDNTAMGIQGDLFNGNGAPNGTAQVFNITNGLSQVTLTDVMIAHNASSIVADSVDANSPSGFANENDHTQTDHAAPAAGAFLERIDFHDNIAPGSVHMEFNGGGGFSPVGVVPGLNQHGCADHGLDALTILTPFPRAGICSWTFANNVIGAALWAGQDSWAPLPSANCDPDGTNCVAAATGGGCAKTGATCFPAGTAFTTATFVNYNGGLAYDPVTHRSGDLSLQASSPYNVAVDGSRVGPDFVTLKARTAGVWAATPFPALSITTTHLPDGSVAQGTYQAPLAASGGASPLIEWTVAAGALPQELTVDYRGAVVNRDLVVRAAGGARCDGGTAVTITTQAPHRLTNAVRISTSGVALLADGIYAGTATGASTISVAAPCTVGSTGGGGTITPQLVTYAFTVQVRDGARQRTTQPLVLLVR
jgi:hypothetical protein